MSCYFLSPSTDSLIHFASASPPKGKLRGTAAEKARQRHLEDDPLVVILNPELVKCKLCGCDIKLSRKSSFDLCHWTKHRERCLKKSKSARQGQRKVNKVRGLSCYYFVFSTLLDCLQTKNFHASSEGKVVMKHQMRPSPARDSSVLPSYAIRHHPMYLSLMHSSNNFRHSPRPLLGFQESWVRHK